MKKNKIGIGQNATLVPVTINDTAAHPVVPGSGALVCEDVDNVSFVLITTNTLAGAWTIQASNDFASVGEYNALANAGTWVDVTALFTSMAAVLSGGSTRFTQCVGFAFRAVRPVFTATSGTGVASGFPFCKGAQ